MKKLLLSLLTAVSFVSFAQKDASVRLVAPASGLEIASNKPFAVSFVIKNIGVDTITNMDSFALIPLVVISNNPQPIANLLGAFNIAPGDSLVLGPQGGAYSLTIPSDIGQASFCVLLSFKDTALDVNKDNNLDCHDITLVVNHTAVSEVNAIASSVKAYPNPANSYFTITMKSTNATVDIMDITGKLVETAPVSLGEARMDVSNYKNGVYFYQIKGENNSLIKSGKFNVSH